MEEYFDMPDWLKESLDRVMYQYNSDHADELNLEDVTEQEWTESFGWLMLQAGQMKSTSIYSRVLVYLKQNQLNQNPKASKDIHKAFKKGFTREHIQKYLASIDKFEYAPEHLKEGLKPCLDKARTIFENYLAFVLLTGKNCGEQVKQKYPDISMN